jgi:hypothetical protein
MLRCIREWVRGRDGIRLRRIVLKGKNLVGREDTFEDGEKGRHGYLLLERSDASIFLHFALFKKKCPKSLIREKLCEAPKTIHIRESDAELPRA